MLDSERPKSVMASADFDGATVSQQTLSYVEIIASLRRQFAVVICFLILGFAFGGIYITQFKPAFQATATLLIDTRKYPDTPQALIAARTIYDSSAAIDTQVEILKSRTLAEAIVKRLRLWKEPEFVMAGGGPRSLIASYIGIAKPTTALSDEEARGRAVAYLLKHLTAKRVSDTFLIDITFDSAYADQAANVANAAAQAFIDYQRNLHQTAIASAGGWLEERIRDLKQKSVSGQRSVAEYQAENSVFDTSGGQPANDRRLTELSDQLDVARTQAADAQSKLNQLSQLNVGGDSATSDLELFSGLENISREPSIVALRQQYVQATTRYEQMSKILPPSHEVVVALRNQIQGGHIALLSEFTRVRLMIKNSEETALDKIKTLQAEISATINESRAAATAQAALKQLEINAQTYQNLYDSFLRQYAEALEAGRSPAAEASIISVAEPPPVRNYKKAMLVFAAFPGAALLLGGALGFFRETVSRPFWTNREVEDKLGTPCADVIPKVTRSQLTRAQAAFDGRNGVSSIAGPRPAVRKANLVSRYAIEEPLSRFAEGIRSIRVALRTNGFEGSRRAVGFTSALPNEGKSSVALAVAAAAARGGVKTVLVDCDFRNPVLTASWLQAEKKAGLVEILSGVAKVDDVILVDFDTNLHFVPGGIASGIKSAGDLMTSQILATLVRDLKVAYDLVIVDLPPMSPINDVAVSSGFIDGYVLTIEWGKTKIETVNFAFRKMPQVHENIIVTVLNKVDLKRLKKFGGYIREYYSNKYVGRYLVS